MGGLLIDLTSVAIALLLRYTLSHKTNLIQIHQLLTYILQNMNIYDPSEYGQLKI